MMQTLDGHMNLDPVLSRGTSVFAKKSIKWFLWFTLSTLGSSRQDYTIARVDDSIFSCILPEGGVTLNLTFTQNEMDKFK